MPRLIPLCAATDLPEGGDGVRFLADTGAGTIPAFVLRWHQGVYAYGNHCPHAGLELDWNPGKFLDGDGDSLVCAAHGALFEPDTGLCVGGPCHGRALQRLPVIERDGRIFLEAEQ